MSLQQIGMEGKGFEPTADALFGTNGFFPDTVMKTMYFVSDNMPVVISDTLEKIVPALRRHRVKVIHFVPPVSSKHKHTLHIKERFTCSSKGLLKRVLV